MATPTIEKCSPAMAKSCVACRTSKVKCEPGPRRVGDPNEGSRLTLQTSGCCRRCERLGLHCIFEQSRRGQANKQRDIARLGPCVRALLRTTVAHGPDDNTLLSDTVLQNTRGADDDVLQFAGSDCQRKMVERIWTREGQVALLRHWLLVGLRSGSCGLLGNVLILAHSCNIALDTVSLKLDGGGLPSRPEPLPLYLREWMDQPHRLCCCRSQVQGTVSWQPNSAFVRAVGDEQALTLALSLPTDH